MTEEYQVMPYQKLLYFLVCFPKNWQKNEKENAVMTGLTGLWNG
jgi:hypothetical protein